MSSSPESAKLSHLDSTGQARMVDVSSKPVTERVATASARVRSRPEVIEAILAGDLPKGEALAAARLAGIQGAKKTADLIPLCHPMTLDWVEISFARSARDAITVTATAKTTARTGVEMEAVTAAAIAALTIYDMAKAADKSIEIGPLRLERKTGGRSGNYIRNETA